MPFNPSDSAVKKAEEKSGGGNAEPGTYNFKVDDAEYVKFKENAAGVRNNGCKLTLLVATGDRDLKSFDNLIYTDKALWKFMAFIHSLGLRSKDKPAAGWDEAQFIGLTGRAEFEKDDRGYLKVKAYLEADEGAKPAKDNHPNAPGNGDEPPPDDRDVVF